jgi:hypothetical protein
MSNSIVQVNVQQVIPAAPSTLQQTGAIISQGGTNTVPGTLSLLTQTSDLTALLPANQLVTLAQTAGLATGTVSAGHGWNVGDVVQVSISGATPTAYNGIKTATITSTTQFTFAIASGTASPATGTITVFLSDETILLNQVTEFFAQGSSLSVYVLELGEGTATEGVAYLTTWIAANSPQQIYSYLVPPSWDNNSSFLTLLSTFNTTTSKTYFFITTTTGTYTNYPATDKCAFTLIQSPNAPTNEATTAAPWWVTLSYAPGTSAQVTQLGFSYLQDVTAYPLTGNATLLSNLRTAGVNYVDTGAEGGISNTILKWGKLMDTNQFGYWYSIDWLSINTKLQLANAVINGSNNPLAPLDYNQQGVNYLQQVLVTLCNNGVSFGLGNGTVKQTQLLPAQFAQNIENNLYLGQIVVNAWPLFGVGGYSLVNPTDYKNGIYGGFSILWVPQLGFQSIVVDVDATSFL